MNTHDLEAFLAVIETGSLMAAAVRLNLTQPGVTRRLQNLEEQLGVQLFERPAKPLRPTLAGRETYEHGRRVIQAIEDLRSGASPSGAIRGELRIGVTVDLSEPALATPIDRVRDGFPDLTVRLTTGWSPGLIEQVARNQIDAAAITLPESVRPPEDLAARALQTQPVIVVAGRDLALSDTATLADLARQPWVTSQDGCGFRTTLRRRMEAAGYSLIVGVEAPGTDLRLSLVARGLGLAIVTPGKLALSPFRDRIRTIAVAGFEPRIRSWLIHRSSTGRLRRPIALFGDVLKAEMGVAPAETSDSDRGISPCKAQ